MHVENNNKAEFQEAKKTPINFNPKTISRGELKSRYKTMLKKLEDDGTVGKEYCFKCPDCKGITKTVKRQKGKIDNQIPCPECNKTAYFEPGEFEELEPTREWMRPKHTLCQKLRKSHPLFIAYVLNGGLIDQEIE